MQEENYTNAVKKIIIKYRKREPLHYRFPAGLQKEFDILLKEGVDYFNQNDYRRVFELAKALIKPLINLITEVDDSNGDIQYTIETAIQLLYKISISDEASMEIREDIFDFLQKELNDRIYFDYGDSGIHLFSVFLELAVRLNKSREFIQYVDSSIIKLTGEFDNYEREFLQTSKIIFLQHTGKDAEANTLLQQHMDIVEVRAAEVEKAIQKEDFAAAKKLIAGGIKIAKAEKHPGTVSDWEKSLLRMAVLQKDIATVRKYAKHFAFDISFSEEHYKQWKKTFTAKEWKIEIEKHIAETIQKITKEWQKQKNNFWRTEHPEFLEALAPVFIGEGYWDRLLELLRQENDLDTTLEYHHYLAKDYGHELLELYLPALEAYGISANTKGAYVDLVSKMKQIIKDIPEGRESILDIARRLYDRFSHKPRRPTMLAELEKILKT